MLICDPKESSACGVGFVGSRRAVASHKTLQQILKALCCVEHRGGFLTDGITGDGAGIMTDIPFALFGYKPGTIAVGTLFLQVTGSQRETFFQLLRQTFGFMGLNLLDIRKVPVVREVLGPQAKATQPEILHLFIERPDFCRTQDSLNKRLYLTRQRLSTLAKTAGLYQRYFFVSLSTHTIVYKGLTRAEDLGNFYEDLQSPAFETRFGIFHRRFSTNTRSSWDKVQPFRLIAHNGEINTIAGNASWAYTRQRALGLPEDEVLTQQNISDSGLLNEMVEALKYRSSIPHTEDILAIMIPPALDEDRYSRFWGRAMEAWDGPAFITYSDGNSLGVRMDRNGFRPCRWAMTEDNFYLASEAGVFQLDEAEIEAKGSLGAGDAVKMELATGKIHFRNPSQSRENANAHFDARLEPIPAHDAPFQPWAYTQKKLWLLDEEVWDRLLLPMLETGQEPIGSMGDTARLAIFSQQPRSFFDYFFQNFAQVTNPPLDYLREKMVTNVRMHLGRQPNVFVTKELLPPMPGLVLDSPLLTLQAFAYLQHLSTQDSPPFGQKTIELSCHFSRTLGVTGFRERLHELAQDAVHAVEKGAQILLLTDRDASEAHPPIPSLLALRAIVCALNKSGVRLEASVVVACCDVHTSHHVAALLGFGATAICPVLPLELARWQQHPKLDTLPAETKEQNVMQSLLSGLLKITSKMGISVARSYQSAKLFTAVGLGKEIVDTYFRGLGSAIGGLNFRRLAEDIMRWTRGASQQSDEFLPSRYWFKEHSRDQKGEKHAMTASRARMIHDLVELPPDDPKAQEIYREYLESMEADAPLHLRDLLSLVSPKDSIPLDTIEPVHDIFSRLSAGAMSFGAISAESQRDLIQAMNTIGGRSNSGEGGENPYYAMDGTTATIKQIASARFGVTARYLASGREIEIKMAQGAKPGEGGQLMAVKVDEAIAKARYSMPHVDLISPPPMHDIYSIEDLKQLIFELKQLFPEKPVCVKLVAGANIGTIAAGVVKAGANIIQISGGDGGTGAATLVSMKHAGLPWELGLAEVHRQLSENDLRSQVKLRVDGGLSNGLDLLLAAALGAEEFGFGKLLLVAQGCIMARVCEKNTCPRGIATHAPRFKAKYRGTSQHVVHLLTHIAEDARHHLARLGLRSLSELIGRSSFLHINPKHAPFLTERNISLDRILGPDIPLQTTPEKLYDRGVTALNQRIVDDVHRGDKTHFQYSIRSTDRAVLTRLTGELAQREHDHWVQSLTASHPARHPSSSSTEPQRPFQSHTPVSFTFVGSAGQGFAAFLGAGCQVLLQGEANDSVCKSMSGGRVVIVPPPTARIVPEKSSIIGNGALYGATAGELYVRGGAGDRFAVRNSGATAVVEFVGTHACCYMTAGTVLILGSLGYNAGSGMTGGKLFCLHGQCTMLNEEYLVCRPLDEVYLAQLTQLLETYASHTQSETARHYLTNSALIAQDFVLVLPKALSESLQYPVRS